MFKHGSKEDKEDKRKEKERLKSEKKAEKEDRKRSTTAITDKPQKSAPRDIASPERSLSSTSLPTNDFKPSSPIVSPRSNSRVTLSPVEQLALEPATEIKTPASVDVISPRKTPPLSASTSQSLSSSPPPTSVLATSMSSSLGKSADIKRVSNETNNRSHSPVQPAVANNKHPEQINLLKSKIGSLPPDTKQLVECLLNIFGRALPDKWSAPPNLDISLDDQVDVTLDKLVEASEILFNKDAPSLLKRYGKDLKESPNRRTDKWKSITNMLGAEDAQFMSLYLSSDILDAIVVSALSKPLEADEVDVLAELMKLSVIHDINLKELLSVLQASSKSNAHVKNTVDENKSLSDAVVELVTSLRKLHRSPSEEFHVQDLKKDDVSESLNQSIGLLDHANTIKHAKGGHDILSPLGKFFEKQIIEEIKEGERWQYREEEAKEEKAAKILDIDGFISEEEGKLKGVQENITDLEAKLEQKKAEEKRLQESLEQKLKEREEYIKEREKAEAELKAHIEETSQHLEHHKKAEESIVKFSEDIDNILNKEVNETLKRTKEVLQELDKEVTFLEEKMVTYERSISLFNAADEPEVLDGLKKLFTRSTAIYAESKLSVSRVTGVVELLRTVLGSESSEVEQLANNLEKIITRQTTLNNKYKLQKEQ